MEKLNYKISSRTAILLGRENVSKADGAIIELIKNSYDADATKCYLIFNLLNDSIYIIDNGCGMNKDIIKNNWLTIGTDNKKNNYISKNNRIRSGEKGIGRLALDRLGNSYELFTKMENDKLLHLKTTWSDFEKESTNLEDIDVILEEKNGRIVDVISNESFVNHIDLYEQGTIIKINQLRDQWTENELKKIFRMLGYLIPPIEQSNFQILYMDSFNNELRQIENLVNEEYDYKIKSTFDGEKFKILLYRNEYDINRIPDRLFKEKEFSKYPYRKEDFINKKFEYELSISELLNSNDEQKIEKARNVGSFTFDYIFMKLTATEKNSNNFYYKKISKNREIWIKENSGIKIYRDGFMVRPYGDSSSSDGYDWLGLDARKAQSPAAITHKGMGWKVRNLQGQGTLNISRINNYNILDKSSREGIIDNDFFSLLKEMIKNIISIFEKDRAYVSLNFKKINEKINGNAQIQIESLKIAENILSNNKNDIINNESQENNKKLAQAINIYQDEREELISEIKLLRALSTNGLITTSIAHDLKTINATLVQRVHDIENSIKNNNKQLINMNLKSLMSSDEFLKSWITVLIDQVKSDRRKRKNELIYNVIYNTIHNLKPILDRKKITVTLNCNNEKISRKIFITDFESIMYNLIINSIESFENSDTIDRKINILITDDNEKISINYKDNGNGLGDKFSEPREIFDFGVTSKYNKNGEKEGTGLGMYIVASTINEYNGEYDLIETKNRFEFEFSIPNREVK